MQKLNIYAEIEKNKRRTWFLMSGFIILLALLGYAFDAVLSYGGNLFISFLIFAFFWTLISYFASARISLALNGAKAADPERYKYLIDMVEGLSIAAGIKPPKVYIIETPAMNAFATGRDPDHSYVAFTTGILNALNRQELEAVAAHEISHIKNYDIRVMTIAVMLAGLIVMIADLLSRMFYFSSFGGHYDRDESDSRKGTGLSLFVLLIVSIIAALFARLLMFAISREREYLADASAAFITKNPEALASALEKIAFISPPFERANASTAHLFIVSPFKGKNLTSWLASLFSTHPPVEERIARLRSL